MFAEGAFLFNNVECLYMLGEMYQYGCYVRIHLDKVSTMGRATQGVRLIKPQEGTFVSTVSLMSHSDDEEEETNEDKGE